MKSKILKGGFLNSGNEKEKTNPKILEIKKIVLEKIKPKKNEAEEMKNFLNDLLRVSKIIAVDAEPLIVGSMGRGTWLSGDNDIDLFLLFPKGISREELEEKGLKYGKKITEELSGKYMIKYAEHPYVRAEIKKRNVDIVPCYKIKKGERIISAVDRSPLHLKYVLSKLDPSLRDEVRILKQFFKGIGVYGSDLKNLGISGYACELLVIKYGKFENVIEAISKMKPGTVIDIERYWKSVKKVKEKFKNEVLILIDPVDKNRNTTASLSSENFIKIVSKTKEFLENPSIDFFFKKKKELTNEELKKIKSRGTKFIGILFEKPDIINDILYPQVRKASERLSKLLESHDFRLIRKCEFVNDESNKVYLIFELEFWTAPKIEKKIGPPIFVIKNSNDFLSKYKDAEFGPYVENNCWVIEKERRFDNASSLLKNFLSKDENELIQEGIPSYIAKSIQKEFRIIEHKEFWKTVKNDKELSSFLKEKYFEKIKI